MNRYKILKVEEMEIEIFEEFLNRVARKGWHPVNHWTRRFSILKFTKDISKKGLYTVALNQSKTDMQFERKKGVNSYESDDKFRVLLETFNVTQVLTYNKEFNIYYSADDQDIFTDKVLQNQKILTFVKSRLQMGIIFTILNALAFFYYLFSADRIWALTSQHILVLIFWFSQLIFGLNSLYKSILYQRGKSIIRKTKWYSINTDFMSYLLFFFKLSFITGFLILVFQIYNSFTLSLIPILMGLGLLLYFSFLNLNNSSLPDKKLQLFKNGTVALVLLVLIITTIGNLNSIRMGNNGELPFDEDILSCVTEPQIVSEHSFFVQKYNISCGESQINVIDIKAPFFKNYFKNYAMKTFKINNYVDGQIYDGITKFKNEELSEYKIYVENNLIISSKHENNELFLKLINSEKLQRNKLK